MVNLFHSSDRQFNVTGIWNTTMGRLELVQTGNNIRGVYPSRGGTLDGVLSGNIMTGSWQESLPPYHFTSGRFRFVFDEPFHFHGTWGYGGMFTGGPWDGRKVQ